MLLKDYYLMVQLVRLEKYENQQEGKQSKEVIADAYVKYNYFHKEQNRAQ